MKKEIAKLLQKAIEKEGANFDVEQITSLIETPPSTELGDYAFPTFQVAAQLKTMPVDLAQQIRSHITKLPKEVKSVETKGPYINFFLDRNAFTKNLIKTILKEKDIHGKFAPTGKKTMVEFPSPNTNKPLHLGHLKNMAIGESVSRILEFHGEKVIRANMNNDRGIHICKSMLAYQRWGRGKKPSKKLKSDHLVGDFYVMFNKKEKQSPKLETEAHALLRKFEQGDKETLALAKKMNKWALDGFKETYKKFGIKHNKEYYETNIYTKGKEIVIDGVKKGIFKQQDDGSVKINLEKEGLGEKYLLRPDGTSLYITQDLYLAKLKLEEFKLDSSIYVTGNEQEYHFKVLFDLLKKLELPYAENLHHLSYGMVNLPEGKMKSREGKIVDADDLIAEVQELVKKELKKRKVLKSQIEKRSLTIALAALKYYLLKTDIKKTLVFNSKESINFEGNTGPYLLYSYARANSILRKSKSRKKTSAKQPKKLEQKEIDLVKKLSEFQKISLNAYKTLNPSLIANYSYQLAQIFNEFYHTCPVIKSDKQKFRLELVEAFKVVLKNSLTLLGIDVLEKM